MIEMYWFFFLSIIVSSNDSVISEIAIKIPLPNLDNANNDFKMTETWDGLPW